MHQAPRQFGELASRWKLSLIRKHVAWLSGYSLSGIGRLLRALGYRIKRGQAQMHSPDPEYMRKKERIQACLQDARDHPGEVVTLFEDEFSFYRWPTVAPVYAPVGRKQPSARLPPVYNTRGRVAIAIHAGDGQVIYRQRAHLDVLQLVGFLEDIRERFKAAKTIYYIQDNWHNVHFHAQQIAAAQRLGIHLVALPTYSPWLNPTEKVGRKLRQEIMHMHPLAEDWPALKDWVCAFLDKFANGSSELLRYVGLSPG